MTEKDEDLEKEKAAGAGAEGADDDIEIVTDDDEGGAGGEGGADKDKAEGKPKPKDAAVGDDDLEKIRSQMAAKDAELAEERERRTALEKEREEERKKLKDAVDAKYASDEIAISNALVAAENDLDHLKKELSAAWAEGDYEKAADVQVKLNKAGYTAQAMAYRKQQLEAHKQRVTEEAAQQQTRTETEKADPMASFTPRTRRWLEANPDVMNDPQKWRKAMAAHNVAQLEDIEIESDEYFALIEEKLGMKKKADEENDDDAPPQRRGNGTSSAVPPSRSGGNGNSRRNVSQVRLSMGEREIAESSFPHLPKDQAYREYAKNKLALEKEGKLS